MRGPESTVAEVSDADLARYAKAASFVIGGRVRFTGSATANDPNGQRTYKYVIVETDEYLSGDPFEVHPRYQRSFPLLELVFRTEGPDEAPAPVPEGPGALDALTCRNDEHFVFFVDLPGMSHVEGSEKPPAPVERSFGVYEVHLVAVVPASAKDRVLAIVRR